MIIKIARKTNNDIKYEFISGDNIDYYGRILSPSQIELLKYEGSTPLSNQVYNAFPTSVLQKEIADLLGVPVTRIGFKIINGSIDKLVNGKSINDLRVTIILKEGRAKR